MANDFTTQVVQLKGTRRPHLARRTGLNFLGISFSIWAAYSIIFAYTPFRSYFSGHIPIIPLMETASLIATVLGLATISLSFSNLPKWSRNMEKATITAFALANVAGFIYGLIYEMVIVNRLNFTAWYPLYSIIEQTIIFIGYLSVFSIVLFPFINKAARWGLAIPAALALVYMAMVIYSGLMAYVFFIDGIPTPAGVSPSLMQLFSPFFGIPGTQLSNGITNFTPGNAMYFAAAANIAYAFLSFFYSGVRGGTHRKAVKTITVLEP